MPRPIRASSATAPPGVGSASHLAGEMLKTMAGIDMVHVPNKGMNPALLDLIGGQVQALFASVPGLINQKPEYSARSRWRRMKRSALLPDLPTIDESGLPGFAVANWAGLLGPAGLDPKIVKKLHDEIIAIIATAEMKERIKTLGYDLIREHAGRVRQRELKSDIDRWGPVAKRAGRVREIGGPQYDAVQGRRAGSPARARRFATRSGTGMPPTGASRRRCAA